MGEMGFRVGEVFCGEERRRGSYRREVKMWKGESDCEDMLVQGLFLVEA